MDCLVGCGSWRGLLPVFVVPGVVVWGHICCGFVWVSAPSCFRQVPSRHRCCYRNRLAEVVRRHLWVLSSGGNDGLSDYVGRGGDGGCGDRSVVQGVLLFCLSDQCRALSWSWYSPSGSGWEVGLGLGVVGVGCVGRGLVSGSPSGTGGEICSCVVGVGCGLVLGQVLVIPWGRLHCR